MESMKRTLLSLFVLGCVALIGAYIYAQLFYFPEKTKSMAIQALRNNGFGTMSYQSVSQTHNEIKFHNAALDKKSLSTINEISIKTFPAMVLLGKSPLQSISITGVNLLGTEGDDGSLSFSGVQDNQDLVRFIRTQPFTDLYIEDSTIDILTNDFGGIRLKLNGHIKKSNTISVITAYLHSTQKHLAFSAKLSGEVAEDSTVSLTADIEKLSVKTDGFHIKRGTASADFTYAPQQNSLNYFSQATISSALWNDFPLGHAQLNMNKEGDILTIDGKGSTHGHETIEWRIRSIQTSSEIQRDIKIIPEKVSALTNYIPVSYNIVITPHSPGFLDTLPISSISIHHMLSPHNTKTSNGVFNVNIDHVKNPIKLAGKFSIKDQKISASLDPQDTPFTIGNNDKKNNLNASFIYNMDGALTLDHQKNGSTVLKWALKPHIQSAQIDFGALFIQKTDRFTLKSKDGTTQKIPFTLPLKTRNNGNLILHLEPIEKPHREEINFSIFDGLIRTETPITQSGNISLENELSVSDINLGALFSQTGFNHVKIKGEMGGIIPVKVNGKHTMINGGILQSQEGGVVRISEDLAYKFFPGNTTEILEIREALKNYHYEYFEIRLDGNITGRTMTTLTARGHNPDMKGEPVIDINMQVETQLSEFFKNILK